MGLLTINCPACKNEHQWFTGSLDQRCSDCRGTTVVFDKDNNIIPVEALKSKSDLRREVRAEKMKQLKAEMKSKRAAMALTRRKKQLKKAANKFARKRKRLAESHTPMRDLKEFDSKLQALSNDLEVDNNCGVRAKIGPETERLLFPYYMAGASIRALTQQFGTKYGFGLGALYTCRDFYKWDQRRAVIRNVVMTDSGLQMSERVKDYLSYFDDLLSESMIRFAENSATGQNKNPFNTLKITNIKDIKDLTELMINLANGGVKKVEIENKNGVHISNKKAEALLEILAADEDKDENK